eukprot:1676441-Rhodomonas_salina.1
MIGNTFPVGKLRVNGIRQEAHDDIVRALTDGIHNHCQNLTVHLKPRVDSLGPCTARDARLATYEPDTVLEWVHDRDHQPYLVVLEFTRSIREDSATQRSKVVEKVQAYHTTKRHLQRSRGAGTRVLQHRDTFVMSCHGAIIAPDWDRALSFSVGP